MRSRIALYRRIRTDLDYRAFFSYSGDRDRRWLPHLQRAIERLSRPWYEPPRIRIFLDSSGGVSIGPRLWAKIVAGLDRSNWLVVMASPEAKESKWVTREIEWWLTNKSAETILLVVTAGQLVWDEQRRDWDPERSTALPACLLGQFNDEPAWKTAAPSHPGSGADPLPDIDRIALGIASVVRDLPEADLRSEGLRDTKRNLRTAKFIAVVLGLLLLIATTVSVIAVIARDEATRQRDHAIAQQLISQSSSLATVDPFGARLKALAAWRIDPTPESRLAVLNAAVNPESGLLAHSGPVRAVAFSPDGRTIATGGDDGVVRLWDAATQRKIGTPLIGHNDGITSLAFGPGGRTLASSSFDGTARLWNVTDHQQIGAAFDARVGPTFAVALSPDGRTLLTGGGDDFSIRIWDVATRRRLGKPLGGPAYGGAALSFSPDGRTFASGIDDDLQLWDTSARTPTGRALARDGHGISSIAFSTDGKTLAATDLDGSVRLWNTTTRAPIGKPLIADHRGAESVAFSPDNTMLATAYDDGSVQLWDVVRHVPMGAPFTGHTSTVWAVAFSPDGSTLASASNDTTVRLWDVRTQRQTGTALDASDQWTPVLSPRGRFLAVAGSDSTVRFWDIAAHRRRDDPLVSGDLTGDSNIAFNPDGTVLATASYRSNYDVQIWDITAHRQIGKTLPHHTGEVLAMAFSPDGGRLAVSDGESVRMWNLATQRQIGSALDGRAMHVEFSPDGRTVATSTEDDTVALWDAATQRRIGETPPAHTSEINALKFRPDGTMLATAGRDNTVRLWSTATHKQIGEPLTGHRDSVTSLAFSPDGKTLATGSRDLTIRLWDVATREQIGEPLQGHSAGVTAVGFAPTGKTIVSWGQDNTARLWNVDATVDPVQTLCGWARGAFDADQWRAYVPPGPAARQLCPLTTPLKPNPQTPID
ncbi:MAG: hypothetical protein HOV92_03450 [Streptomyces sp.]|nr:hypothetical protein [Streptomyces sp.]